MAADLGELAVGANEFIGAAFWVGGGEADAGEARDGGEGFEEAWEGLCVAAGAGGILFVPRGIA